MSWTMVDADEIVPGLWQGGAPPIGDQVAERGFQTLVLCAEEFQPPSTSYPGVKVLYCPFDDTDEPLSEETWAMIDKTATEVAVRVRMGQKVLVTCMAGINRSGLVNAVVVHKLTGVSGEEAVRIVQAGRPHALHNESFVAALEKIKTS